MQFIDLGAQQRRIGRELREAVERVFSHGQYIMGPEVGALEQALAPYVGVPHALGCASGTDALLMALMALDVGPGDLILTTPFTFVATAEVVSLLGATPVFVDIDPVTFNLTPEGLRLTLDTFAKGDAWGSPLPRGIDLRGRRPKGLIVVDLFGLPADYEGIEAAAAEAGIFLVEDAAQSFGAEIHGKKACSFGTVSCTSFFPAKPLGCYGDGGMCFTRDPLLDAALRSIRIHGQGRDKYENVRIGINGRLDTLQAAILLEKFRIFPEELLLRQEVARRYTEALEGRRDLVVPRVPAGVLSAWAQYCLLARDTAHRRGILETLKARGVPTAIYYPIPLHLQKAYASLGYRAGDFPVSEAAASRIFSVPMHPYLDRETQARVIEGILAGAGGTDNA